MNHIYYLTNNIFLHYPTNLPDVVNIVMKWLIEMGQSSIFVRHNCEKGMSPNFIGCGRSEANQELN